MFDWLRRKVLSPRDQLKHKLLRAVGKNGGSCQLIEGREATYRLSIHEGWGINWDKNPYIKPPMLTSVPFWSTAPDDLVEAVIDDLDNILERCRRDGAEWRSKLAKEEWGNKKKEMERLQRRERVDKKIMQRFIYEDEV